MVDAIENDINIDQIADPNEKALVFLLIKANYPVEILLQQPMGDGCHHTVVDVVLLLLTVENYQYLSWQERLQLTSLFLEVGGKSGKRKNKQRNVMREMGLGKRYIQLDHRSLNFKTVKQLANTLESGKQLSPNVIKQAIRNLFSGQCHVEDFWKMFKESL